jgi:RNA polymerase sigma factor (sigma-70 family)
MANGRISNTGDLCYSPLSRYLKEIVRHSILTHEDEIAIGRRIQTEEEKIFRILTSHGILLNIAARDKRREDGVRELFDLDRVPRNCAGDFRKPLYGAVRRLYAFAETARSAEAAIARCALRDHGQWLPGLQFENGGAPDIADAVDDPARAPLRHQPTGKETGIARARKQLEALRLELGLDVQTLYHICRQIERCEVRANTARMELVRANLRLVVSIAKKYKSSGIPLDDLIQEGNIGLVQSAENYNHRLNCRFATYAVWWIWQSIVRYIKNQSHLVRVPAYITDALNKLIRAQKRLASELGREPTTEEVAGRSALPPAVLRRVQRLSPTPLSLETPVGENESALTLKSQISDQGTPSPCDNILTGETCRITREMLCTLKPREEWVIRMRFGIGDAESHTLEQIAARCRITKERVRQIEMRAMKKLRLPVRSEALRCLVDEHGGQRGG